MWRQAGFSPRRRGSSRLQDLSPGRRRVLPAQAGVIPPTGRHCGGAGSSPRAGGGHPDSKTGVIRRPPFSPRRRGSSRPVCLDFQHPHVLPAQAGVIPPDSPTPHGRQGSPRAGGGHPWTRRARTLRTGFSPRRRGSSTWQSRGMELIGFSPRRRGSSLLRAAHHEAGIVLPAQAGVIPRRAPMWMEGCRSPRAGGGHPGTGACQIFPGKFSPRRRGSSQGGHDGTSSGRVLPAQAGVIPGISTARRGPNSSPRAGGGHPGQK